jgi:predicted nucleic acid-binding protein
VTYTDLDFVDALNVAYINEEGIKQIITYDHHFNHIPQVNSQEINDILIGNKKEEIYL